LSFDSNLKDNEIDEIYENLDKSEIFIDTNKLNDSVIL